MGIRFGAVKSILADILGISKASVRWVLRMLTDNQKRTPLDIYRYLLSRYEDDPKMRHGLNLLGKSKGDHN